MDLTKPALNEGDLHPGDNEIKTSKKTDAKTNPLPSGNAKKKRKRRIRTNIPSDNVTTNDASASQPDTCKDPLEAKKLQPAEQLLASPTNHKTSDQENHSKNSEISARKGRNAKKKAPAANENSQICGTGMPVSNSAHPRTPHKLTPTKPFRNVPAGLQPMHYLGQSPQAKQDSPKQEKFLPYWPTLQVEVDLISGSLISGVIRINPRNYQKAYITPADDEDAKDVLIDGIIDRNRALEGDEVAVKLYDKSKWQLDETADGELCLQKTGMVVSILVKHHNRCTVGYLKLASQAAKSTPKKSGNISQIAVSPATGSSSSQSPNIQTSIERVTQQSDQNLAGASPGPAAKPAENKDVPYKMPDKVLFSPRDARMPRMWIRTSSLPSGTPTDLNPANCQNHLFLASIHEWNVQPIANGKLLNYIGEADEVETETSALLLEQGLDVTPYPKNIFTLPPLPFQIPEKELNERLDLRSTCIFTIDPETAKDLDDALSVRELGEGLLEVGVHIADPSFFLEEDSPLDLLVRERATSIYLVQNVFHMLPKELCLLCSLLPGEDKLAFSLIMTVDTKTWKVISHKFSRSIVNSCAQLSYEHAQAFIKDPECVNSVKDFPSVHNGYTVEDLCRAVNLIWPFSAALRERRFSYGDCRMNDDKVELMGGALKINQPKLCFKLDGATCMPQDVFVYQNKESNNLIEELMLLANILTAERLASMFPKLAFLRRHSKPKLKLLNDLAQILMHYGIHIDTSTAGALNASLEKYGAVELVDLENSVISCSDSPSCNASNTCVKLIGKAVETENDDSKEFCDGGDTSEETVQIQQDIVVSTSSSSSATVSTIEESLRTLVVGNNEGETSVLEDKDKMSLPSFQCSKDASPLERKFEDSRQNSDACCPPSPKQIPSDQQLSLARGLVLNHLCAKPMMRAEYYCFGAKSKKVLKSKGEDDGEGNEEEVKVSTHHYALNVPLYTHFTSPIRRYADIMVHRLLAASLGYHSPPQLDPSHMQSIATNCNKQKYGAKKASEASNELFFRLWVRLQVENDGCSERIGNELKTADSEERRSEGGLRETAVVVNAKDYSFDAILLRFGVTVRVYVNKLPATVKNVKKQGSSVISIHWFLPGEKTEASNSPVQDITTFSVVNLAIYYSYSARRIRAELLSPFSP